ncbi:MAG TPA: HU family DNA-binding protein [Gemmataceae bacterium]|nr:HU family DNA-binding protein [Gemmataceae bacterium]
MTKKDMANTIAEAAGITQAQAREIVQGVFESMIQTLVKDGRIELRKFGVFKVKKRKSRQGRNPRTGEKVLVPERTVVTFKAGEELEERVRQSQRP